MTAAPSADGKKGEAAAKPDSAAATVPSEGRPHKYGRVILTISNSVLPLERLSPSPSAHDGMSQETELDFRNLGCSFIQTAGKLLRLPQVAMATACVLYQRFFYSKSFIRYNFEHYAMGCLTLATKIEEAPRRPRDIINVFTHIKQVRSSKPIKPVILNPDYIRLKDSVIKAERRVLKELGFCVHMKHPHKLIVMYLQVLSFQDHQKFAQMSWNFMNDSLRTDCFVRYTPETIACACIYLSARKLNIPLPKKPAWFELLGVEEDDIRDCCYRIICLYQRKKVSQEELEKEVDRLKTNYENKKKEAKLHGSSFSTAVNSPASQPPSPHRKDKKVEDRSRSRSRSVDRKKKKKYKKGDRSRSPSSDRGGRDRRKKRDWSNSPIHKSRKHRSRSRERLSESRSKHEYRSDRSGYSDKYRKGTGMDGGYYRR